MGSAMEHNFYIMDRVGLFMRTKNFLIIILCIALISVFSVGVYAQWNGQGIADGYRILDLGTLGVSPLGHEWSEANDINCKGQITGTSTFPGNGNYRAFKWSPGSQGMINLAQMDYNSHGSAINKRGRVVGWGSSNNGDGSILYFKNDNSVQELVSLSGSNTDGAALSINDKSMIVGKSTLDSQGPNPFTHATFWHKNKIWDISKRALNDNEAIANYVSNDKKIVGTQVNPVTQTTEGFVLDLNNGNVDLIPGLYNGVAAPLAINRNDIAVGYNTPHSGFTRAFVWENGVTTDIGSNEFASYAYDINRHDVIVGFEYESNEGATYAYAYRDGVLKNLNDLIDPNASWDLRVAKGINDRGEIVGWGYHNGEKRAFVLRPVGMDFSGSC